MLTLPLPRRIWFPWEENRNTLIAEKVFQVPDKGGTFRVALSCSGDYQVLINGISPLPAAEPAPAWWAVHYLDVTPHVVAGSNMLRVTCRHHCSRAPYLLLVLDRTENGQVERLVWTASDWVIRDSDVAEGRKAWAFDGVWAEPYALAGNCPDDFLRLNHGRQQIHTTRLERAVDWHDGLGRWLASPALGPLRAQCNFTVGPAQARVRWEHTHFMAHLVAEHLFRQTNEWLDQYEARCPRVVYEIPQETFGRVVLRNAGADTVWLAVTLAESRGEAGQYNRRFTEYFPLAPGEQRATRLSGFRVVKIILLATRGEAQLAPPLVQHVLFPMVSPGEFRTDNEELNRIWDVAVHTLRLCMQNEIWDGARRDYMPWMGDLHVENLATYHAIGDYDLPRHTLTVLRELGPDPVPPLDERVYPGLSSGWRASTNQEVNGMPTYTAWWLVGLHDYWVYSGDRPFLEAQAPGVWAVVERVLSHLNEEGRWSAPDFGEWSDYAPEACRWANHGVATWAVACAARVLRASGHEQTAARCDEALQRMTNGYAEALRASSPGAFHPYVMAVLGGALPAAQATSLFRHYLNHRVETLATPWWRFYELEAASATGHHAWALSRLFEGWSPMLRAGATTFWEQFNADWLRSPDPHAVSGTNDTVSPFGYGGYRTSLCHGWSSGPVVWLHRWVLGVQPVQPGFATIAFAPNLHGLQHATGKVPTPHGPIVVDLRPAAWSITLPEGVCGVFSPTEAPFSGHATFRPHG